jgi:hypothetical protein
MSFEWRIVNFFVFTKALLHSGEDPDAPVTVQQYLLPSSDTSLSVTGLESWRR